GRDEAGEADDVSLLLLRRLQDFRRRHHDTEIDDVVIVALEYDADDVLADVVHVALDRRHDDLAVGAFLVQPLLFFLLLHDWHEVAYRLFHDPRLLHHMRQAPASGVAPFAAPAHAFHPGPLVTAQRTVCL